VSIRKSSSLNRTEDQPRAPLPESRGNVTALAWDEAWTLWVPRGHSCRAGAIEWKGGRGINDTGDEYRAVGLVSDQCYADGRRVPTAADVYNARDEEGP